LYNYRAYALLNFGNHFTKIEPHKGQKNMGFQAAVNLITNTLAWKPDNTLRNPLKHPKF